MPSNTVIVIGGGLAGLSSAVALAEAGFHVRLLEKRPFLGGRAASYVLPDGQHVDNCQHVTLGCCTNLEDFYRRVGAADKTRYYDRLYFADADGRRGIIEADWLPAPFHLAGSFALFPSLSAKDKCGIARAMLRMIRFEGCPGELKGAARISMLEWLRQRGQTNAAIERFWRVVLVSALDEELARTDARYGVDVFWKAFLANRRGYRVGVPTVPLGELYDGCGAGLEVQGGEVLLRAGVREIRVAQGHVAGVLLESGNLVVADYYVAAVPHDALLALLPAFLVEGEPVFAGIRHLRSAPITGVHLWFDRPVMSEPYLTVLDRTTQWIFNKSRLHAAAEEGPVATESDGQYLQLVISASYDLVPRSRQEIIALCLRELAEILPATQAASLRKAAVIKETSATFSPAPGSDRWRPEQRSPLPNLFLAGDWTATGWPATMEGAVRSGYLAAEAILAVAGRPKRFLQPDLPVEPLVRFLSHA